MITVTTASAESDAAPQKPVIVATNYPIAAFVQTLAGDFADARFPVPSGIDPAYWQPHAEEIAAMQQADLVVFNGASYSKWRNKVSLPWRRMLFTTNPKSNELIWEEDTVTHQHGPSGKHSHGGFAFTTWLDFQLAEKQAKAISDRLIQQWPQHKRTIEANFAKLAPRLEQLDRDMAEAAKKLEGQTLIGSHPVYQYLARRYKLTIESVHWEPSEMPPAEEWAKIEDIVQKTDAKLMLWEAQPLPEIASRLKQAGVRVVVFAPAGGKPSDNQPDFFATMATNIAKLKEASDSPSETGDQPVLGEN